MENKVLKKAAEFSSLGELGLPDEMVSWLKDAGASVEDVIAVVRSVHLMYGYGFDIVSIAENLANRGFIDYDYRSATGEMQFGASSLVNKAPFVSQRVGFIGFILREYASVKIMKDWAHSGWVDDSDSKSFNAFYEAFDATFDEAKVLRLLELLKEKLTHGQYEMAEFELTHPEFCDGICPMMDDNGCCADAHYDGLNCYEYNPDEWWDDDDSSIVFTVTPIEYRALLTARYNSRKFLRDEIRAILLS